MVKGQMGKAENLKAESGDQKWDDETAGPRTTRLRGQWGAPQRAGRRVRVAWS